MSVTSKDGKAAGVSDPRGAIGHFLELAFIRLGVLPALLLIAIAVFTALSATQRDVLFVDDHVHLAPPGQQALAQAVAAALAMESR